MAKILLKRVGNIPRKQYTSEIAKIARITVSVQSRKTPYIAIYSNKELTQDHYSENSDIQRIIKKY